MKFDLEESGLRTILKQYEEEAMKYVWSHPNVNSRQVYSYLITVLAPQTISRASVINFLNRMVDEGYLDYHEASGKGGYHRVYQGSNSAPNKEEFRAVVYDRICEHAFKNVRGRTDG